jgi:hypothetical protein
MQNQNFKFELKQEVIADGSKGIVFSRATMESILGTKNIYQVLLSNTLTYAEENELQLPVDHQESNPVSPEEMKIFWSIIASLVVTLFNSGKGFLFEFYGNNMFRMDIVEMYPKYVNEYKVQYKQDPPTLKDLVQALKNSESFISTHYNDLHFDQSKLSLNPTPLQKDEIKYESILK